MSLWMPRWPGLDWGQRARQGSGLACVQSSVQRSVPTRCAAGRSETRGGQVVIARLPTQHRNAAVDSASGSALVRVMRSEARRGEAEAKAREREVRTRATIR